MKPRPHLSRPPEPGPLNPNYFKVPNRALNKTGITGFHERTISRTDGLYKDQARWRVVNVFLNTCPVTPKEVGILSTPGAWWHFERLLEGRLEKRKQKGLFFCCERDPKIYQLSAVCMATIFCGSGVIVKKDRYGTDFVTSTHFSKTLINRDVFDCLKSGRLKWGWRKRKVSCVWLDLTTTLTGKLGERLVLLKPVLREDYCMIAITLIKGRETGAVRDALMAGESRVRYLDDLIREHCGDDFRLKDVFEYADSGPMQQFVFLRRFKAAAEGGAK